MICGVLIVLIIFPRHPHDNMHYWYSHPRCQGSLPLSLVFFPKLWRCSGALAANQLRLAPSQHKCQVCSHCVLTRVFAYVNLTHPVPLLLPLQTSPDNQMKYACSAILTLSQQWPSADAPEEKFHAFSTAKRSQVRHFWSKLAYSHNLGWETRSYRDIPWTTESGLLAAEANYSAFCLFYSKYLQTIQRQQARGRMLASMAADARLHYRCPQMFTTCTLIAFPCL